MRRVNATRRKKKAPSSPIAASATERKDEKRLRQVRETQGKERTRLAGKCKKDGDWDKDKEKEEGALLAGKCKKGGDCDKEKEEEGTLA